MPGRTHKKNNLKELSVLDEIILETDDLLRSAKLEELELQDKIIVSEKLIKEEENRKDPNRVLFHAASGVYIESKSDKIREELFLVKKDIDLNHKKIDELGIRKEALHALKKLFISNNNEVLKMPENECKLINYRILETQEAERNRIANDLHDSTVQNLTTLIHKTELIERFIGTDNDRAKYELSGMSDTIRVIIKEMREIIYNLRPVYISELGLWNTIRCYVDETSKRNCLQMQLNISEEAEAVKFQKVESQIIFLIIQETVNNCLKHAKASKLIINIIYEFNDIRISIKDDGIGFDIKEDINKGTFGLEILRERVFLISGKMEITTNSKGTELIFIIPIIKGGQLNETNPSYVG